MQEIDEQELERQISEAQDPELLKELMGYAIHIERDDLVEQILDRSIRTNRLVEKLQDFELQPVTVVYMHEDEEGFEAPAEPQAEAEAELAAEAEVEPAEIQFPGGD